MAQSQIVKDDPKKPVKAIFGAVVAGLGATTTALTDGAVSPVEVVAIVTSTVVAFGSVYFATNPQVPA